MLRLYNLKNTGNILSKGINISSYFPDKAQEIRNYRNAFEQEKYNREQSAIEDAKWWRKWMGLRCNKSE